MPTVGGEASRFRLGRFEDAFDGLPSSRDDERWSIQLFHVSCPQLRVGDAETEASRSGNARMIEHITSFFELVAYAADIFGLSLLTVGFARGAVGWARMEMERGPWERRLHAVRRLRCVVGTHILYALELMIVSDIIDSFVAVSRYESGDEGFFQSAVFYSLVQLGMVVVIRTAIDYFLAKEISALRDVDLSD